MKPTRRSFLTLMGGGVIASAAWGGYAVTRLPDDATHPWDMAGHYDDPRKRALSWAILAPNPHNRQPWMVDLSVPDEIGLYVDPTRLLPHTDPFSRQIVIGLGCFLETLTIAASQDGFAVETELFPEGSDLERLDTRPVARLRMVADAATPDPDFAHIANRRTQKEPFDTERPVTKEILKQLGQGMPDGLRVDSTNDVQAVAEMRALSAEAFVIEFETPRTYKESVDLFRIGHAEVDANPDGIDFSGPMWETLRLTGLFSRQAALDPKGTSYTQGLDMVTGSVSTAMAHIWINTPGNTRKDQIEAGRAWMRLNLKTTSLGLGLHPLSQALQEYPEMQGLYDEVHKMLARPGETVQMWARLGYCAAVPRSPRWPIEAKIMHV